jgi:hypothetical protein
MAALLPFFCFYFYFLVAGGNKGGSWAALLLKAVYLNPVLPTFSNATDSNLSEGTSAVSQW